MSLEPGQEVFWRYSPRGGYGYVFYAPAYVVVVTSLRVGIAVQHRDRVTWLPRWVQPSSLVPVPPV